MVLDSHFAEDSRHRYGAAQNCRGAFTRTLGTLISSGVPILEGLDITARTSGNAVVEKAISQTRKAVEAGRSLVDPLKETDVFPAW